MYESIDNLDNVINNINGFLSNKVFINIEMISFNNFNLTAKNKDNNIDKIGSNTFINTPKLKEFFINNNSEISITNSDSFKMKKLNKFIYLYLGYDSNNNLIFYRNGTTQIKSIDLLDLLNFFNNKITKIHFKYENINILLNKEIRKKLN